MIVVAHAGHWALGVLQAAPVLVIAAVAAWRSRAGRAQRRHAAGQAG